MPRRKALKVIVDIHLHAITCPGVFLQEQNDVFVYVELLGQRKRTQAMPPVFPFLFHEKIRFDKVFSHCTDPVQIASALNGEGARIELVQLTYPAGELLATYEDNAREFLFPTPRVSPSYPGVDREVLLRRSATFPGIAPKLEFSSRTVIKEVTSVNGNHSSRKKKEKSRPEHDFDMQRHYEPQPIESSTPHPSAIRTSSSSKKKSKQNHNTTSRNGRAKVRASSLSRATTQWGYEQSTIASRARSPSPYTKRRMAQLSINDPFETATKTKPFKTELEERPDFVVRKANRDCLSFNKTPPSLPRVSPSYERRKSPTRRSCSPSRRKQTPGHSRFHNNQDYGSDEIDSETSDEELRFDSYAEQPGSSQQDHYQSWQSSYRPITSPCGLESPLSQDQLKKDSYFRESPKIERDIYAENEITSKYSASSVPLSSVRGSERARRRSPARTVTFKSTAELIDGSAPRYRRSGSGSRPTSARSAPESTPRPVTPRRDLSFSRGDYERSASKSAADPDSILFRRPLRERLSGGEPSPYEKIRDRVRDLLHSPRATRIIDDSIAEANDRYWRRRSQSPTPRTSPRSNISVPLGNGDYWNERSSELLGKSHRRVFEENMDKIYDGIYSGLRHSDT